MYAVHTHDAFVCTRPFFLILNRLLGFREFHALLPVFGVFMTRRGYVLSEM